MRNRNVASFILTLVVLLVASVPSFGQAKAANSAAIPRINGKPDMTGVWAGPGFKFTEGKDVPEINIGAGTFQVYGQKLAFNPQQVKVFNRDGKPGSIFGLKNGANIRFTLDAADTKNRRVAVIYVN